MKKIILMLTFAHFILVLKAQPVVQWQKYYGGIPYPFGCNSDVSKKIIQSFDGNYIITGEVDSHDFDIICNEAEKSIWTIKLNPMGDLIGQICLGGFFWEYVYDIIETSDGSYVLACKVYGDGFDVNGYHGGDGDIWIVKINHALDQIMWQKCLGGSWGELPAVISETADGGFILIGKTASNDGDVSGLHGGVQDAWVVKLNWFGNIEWQKCLGGPGSDVGYSIQQTMDGGYICAIRTSSTSGDITQNHGDSDSWIVKMDSQGNIQWQKCYGGSANDRPYIIHQTNDGGYIFGGTSNSSDGDLTFFPFGGFKIWVVKINDTGVIEWQKKYGGENDQSLQDLKITADGGYIIAGTASSNSGDVSGNHGLMDAWIVKIDNGGTLQWQQCYGGPNNEYAFSIQPTTDGGYIFTGPDYIICNPNDNPNNYDYSANYRIVKLGAFTGVNEQFSNQSNISLFPNPANNIINIKSNLFDNENVQISMTNMLGEIIFDENVKFKDETEINIQTIPPGVIFIKLKNADYSVTKKFIKQ